MASKDCRGFHGVFCVEMSMFVTGGTSLQYQQKKMWGEKKNGQQ